MLGKHPAPQVPNDTLVNISLKVLRKLEVKADVGKDARDLNEGPQLADGPGQRRQVPRPRTIAIGNRKASTSKINPPQALPLRYYSGEMVEAGEKMHPLVRGHEKK